jgi:uncharacterized protein
LVAEYKIKHITSNAGNKIMMVTKEFIVSGMQCIGCEKIIEGILNQIDGIQHVKVSYPDSTLTVSYDDKRNSLATIQKACIAKGYSIKPNTKESQIYKVALSGLVLLGIVVLIMLSRILGRQINIPEISSQTGNVMIFVIGLLTGLHCIGMCGSFIIGYTAKDTEYGRSIYRSHILYGVGKTMSYAMFGAIFGYVGSLLRITLFISGVSICIAGVFLIIYGLNILNLFPIFKALRMKSPVALECSIRDRNHSRSPFFLGFFSGFIIGCGPLQAMYVMAAGMGEPFQGAKLLTLFGLGTLPALLGFGLLTRVLSNKMTRRFLQASGIILIIMGTMMINKGVIRTKSVDTMKSMPPKCTCEQEVASQ